MMQERQIAREISYASSAQTRGGRALIKLMENATGRVKLIRRAKGYEKDIAQGQSFWNVMVQRYGLSLDVINGSLDNIPGNGPLILVANHPYGILDGLMMGHILSLVRGDFRILANQVFNKAEELSRIVLPISFDETKDAVKLNLATRKYALEYLADDGAIGIFPGGTVSTALNPFSRPMDPSWRSFTARMIAKSNAQVVPVYFDGHTSRMFQIASHLHSTLRMGLLINEFRSRVGSPMRVSIGEPISHKEITNNSNDAKSMMDFLRRKTYELSPTPLETFEYGFEFEDQHKVKRKA